MRKVYSSDNNLIVGHLRQVLEDHRIRCILRNEFLWGGVGQLPPTECWPEIWVAEDAQYARARTLVDEVLAVGHERAPDWRCFACGEEIEGQFTQCWRCGGEPPDPHTWNE